MTWSIRDLLAVGSGLASLAWLYADVPRDLVRDWAHDDNYPNPIYHYHLRLSYARSGDSVQAKQPLSSALGLSSSFVGAADARATLASLPLP